MTDSPADAVPQGLADYPLEIRREREAQARREIEEGMARRHAAVAAEGRAIAAANFARLLHTRRGGQTGD